MKNSLARKTGLFSSVLIVMGSIIGIGIFIKNASIFSINDGNSWAILCAWVIGAIIAILKGYSFLEISSIEKNKNETYTGMSLWMDKLVGAQSKRITQMFLVVLYLGFLCPIISGYSLNFFMMFLGMSIKKVFLYTFMFVIPLFFGLLHFISTKIPNRLNIIVTITKAIPLLFVAFVGMFAIKNGGGIGHTMLITKSPLDKNLTIGMLISLPSILFAFDAFLNVASINSEEKNNTSVSKSILIGMVLVAVLYILITISQINVNRGYVSTPYEEVYDKFGNKKFLPVYQYSNNMAYEGFVRNLFGPTMDKIFTFFIAFSGFGVINIIVLAGSTLTRTSMKEEIKHSRIKSIIVFLLITFAVSGLLIGLEEYELSTRSDTKSFDFLNGDAIDAMSNIPVILAFGFYTTLLIAGLINRKTKKVKVQKKKGFIVCSIISIIMTSVIIGTYLGYSLIYQSILDYYASKTLIDSTVIYLVLTIVLFVGTHVYGTIKDKKNPLENKAPNKEKKKISA